MGSVIYAIECKYKVEIDGTDSCIPHTRCLLS